MFCTGICQITFFNANGVNTRCGLGRYDQGQRWCSRYNLFVSTIHVESNLCPCCESKMRSRPRAMKFKRKFRERTARARCVSEVAIKKKNNQKLTAASNKFRLRIVLGKDNSLKSYALKFIILLGVVSLFADMTYEGARSITGPYLAILGASATVVGLVAGLGEFAGYGIRIIFGTLADRTGRYWTITIFGYFLNLLVVPLLALAGNWEIAALLIIAERFGKAIRTSSP